MKKCVSVLLYLFAAQLSAMEDSAELVMHVQPDRVQLHMSRAQVHAVVTTALMRTQLMRAEVFSTEKHDHIAWLLSGVVFERMQQLQQISERDKTGDLGSLLLALREWSDNVRLGLQQSKEHSVKKCATPELRLRDIVVLPSIELDAVPIVLPPIDDAARIVVSKFLVYCQQEAAQYVQELACGQSEPPCVIL